MLATDHIIAMSVSVQLYSCGGDLLKTHVEANELTCRALRCEVEPIDLAYRQEIS